MVCALDGFFFCKVCAFFFLQNTVHIVHINKSDLDVRLIFFDLTQHVLVFVRFSRDFFFRLKAVRQNMEYLLDYMDYLMCCGCVRNQSNIERRGTDDIKVKSFGFSSFQSFI